MYKSEREIIGLSSEEGQEGRERRVTVLLSRVHHLTSVRPRRSN